MKRDINYGEREKDVVKSGIHAIKEVLSGNDINAKSRLLFYLDWFMDPYYEQDISGIERELTDLLQTVIISAGEDEYIIEEAIHLLEAYTSAEYDILRKNMNKVPQKHRPDVFYLLNEP